MFNKLYKVNLSNKSEIKKVIEIVSDNQINDVEFSNLRADNETLKKIISNKILNLIKNSKDQIEIYSSSKALTTLIIFIKTTNKKDKKKIPTAFSNKLELMRFFKYFKLLKPIPVLRLLKHNLIVNSILKKLIFKSDYILYSINVDLKHQGKGYANSLLTKVFNEIDNERKIISTNTNNPSNTHIYEHFGFKLYKIQTESKIKNYQLIRKPQINKIRINNKI